MSTWDDKPNDYEHAVELAKDCQLKLENATYIIERQWDQMTALRDEVQMAKAESAAKRVVIVRLLDALSQIEQTDNCPLNIISIIHKAIAVT